MKEIKRKLRELLSGMINKSGHRGAVPGNFQVVPLPIKNR